MAPTLSKVEVALTKSHLLGQQGLAIVNLMLTRRAIGKAQLKAAIELLTNATKALEGLQRGL